MKIITKNSVREDLGKIFEEFYRMAHEKRCYYHLYENCNEIIGDLKYEIDEFINKHIEKGGKNDVS